MGRIHSGHFESVFSLSWMGNAISDKEKKITKEQMNKGHLNSGVRVPEKTGDEHRPEAWTLIVEGLEHPSRVF